MKSDVNCTVDRLIRDVDNPKAINDIPRMP